MKKFCCVCLLLAALCIVLPSCQKEQTVTVNEKKAEDALVHLNGSEKWQTAVDYSTKENWLTAETDDSAGKRADVLYFYPEIYAAGENENEVCAVDNAQMRAKAEGYLETQAAVFSEECRVFAPYYRQIDRSFLLSLGEAARESLYEYAASKDAAAALDYYFGHYNNGRPFILAGHGQGSEIVRRLVSDYLSKHADYKKRMIAAYAIGCSVTENFVKKYGLKFAARADDVGVIVSYNTEGQDNYGHTNKYISREKTLVINPTSWTTKTEVSTEEKYHLGMMDKTGKIVEKRFRTHLSKERWTLVCDDNDLVKEYATEDDDSLYGPCCCHTYDYQLFFVNLQENVRTRVNAYFR